jgi:hypothetical protein
MDSTIDSNYVCSGRRWECFQYSIQKSSVANCHILRHIIKEYLAHYHAERNHQGTGIGNALLFPDERFSPESDGDVVKSSRLGGMLNFYHREDAA